MRYNEPFKKKISELLGNFNLTFRWDLLHLSNRAHIAARKLTKYERKKAAKNETEISEEIDDYDCDLDITPDNSSTKISELIDYIQSKAKEWRTGIKFTGLILEKINFKRPKIWSNTRMCLYEFEMTLRFLENKHLFEVQ